MRIEDEAADQSGYDPRWEVQPELEPDDDPRRSMIAVSITPVAMTVIVVLLAWLLANAPSMF